MYDGPVRQIGPAVPRRYYSAPNMAHRCSRGQSPICCCFWMRYSCTVVLQPRVFCSTVRQFKERRGPEERYDRLHYVSFSKDCLHQLLQYYSHRCYIYIFINILWMKPPCVSSKVHLLSSAAFFMVLTWFSQGKDLTEQFSWQRHVQTVCKNRKPALVFWPAGLASHQHCQQLELQ